MRTKLILIDTEALKAQNEAAYIAAVRAIGVAQDVLWEANEVGDRKAIAAARRELRARRKAADALHDIVFTPEEIAQSERIAAAFRAQQEEWRRNPPPALIRWRTDMENVFKHKARSTRYAGLTIIDGKRES
jgi:hypothetical protein